jgi:long-chain acyl-CoA synthetase
MRLSDLVSGLSRYPDATVSYLVAGKLEGRSFAALKEDVAAALKRLRSRGFSEQLHVGFLAENGYDWLVHDLAMLELGCHVTALTATTIAGRLEQVMESYGLQALLAVGATAEALLADRTDSWVARASQETAIVARACAARAHPAPDPEHPFRVFSSGTAGQYRCLIGSRVGFEGAIDSIGRDFNVNPSHTLLLFLPVGNLQQKAISYAALEHGVSIAITDPLRLFVMLKLGRPTIILAPPLFYDTIVRRLRTGFAGRVLSLLVSLSRVPILRALVSVPLRRIGRRVASELGGRVQLLFTGMAPISPATLESLTALRLPLYEGYGTTETGNIACSTPEAARKGSVGRLANGIQIKIAEDGEILAARIPPLTVGYVDDPEGTASTYLGDGWVATGDIGFLDADGFLFLRGRKKNIIIMDDGRKLHPEVLEQALMASPLVQQCAVLSGDTGGLVCVVYLGEDKPSTRAATRAHVERCLAELGQGQALEDLVFFPEAFSPNNGLLTANLKLNRNALWERIRAPRQAPEAALPHGA